MSWMCQAWCKEIEGLMDKHDTLLQCLVLMMQVGDMGWKLGWVK
jgi:hypothetical protein